VCVCVCVLFQSEEDFLEESDFDDISVHSASVLSDTSGAATKKKARRGRKKRKSMFTVYTLCVCVFPHPSKKKSHFNPSEPDCLVMGKEEIKMSCLKLYLFCSLSAAVALTLKRRLFRSHLSLCSKNKEIDNQ